MGGMRIHNQKKKKSCVKLVPFWYTFSEMDGTCIKRYEYGPRVWMSHCISVWSSSCGCKLSFGLFSVCEVVRTDNLYRTRCPYVLSITDVSLYWYHPLIPCPHPIRGSISNLLFPNIEEASGDARTDPFHYPPTHLKIPCRWEKLTKGSIRQGKFVHR
jgi:hypothetical protein